MAAGIMGLIVTLLPLILKLVLYIIERHQSSDKLKEEFLKFIASVQQDIPVKLHYRYNEQIERLKQQILDDKERAEKALN